MLIALMVLGTVGVLLYWAIHRMETSDARFQRDAYAMIRRAP
ncbi:hypothetical protein LCGC14_2538670 [marine sediment metagenome]|uniref:Uncharacterized protein n=1 Tax=marine sediment metagenome TaxID=412755 RepID=A0A0F9DJF1_9ZZZZ